MFEVGKHYEFEMVDHINDGFSYYHAEVIAIEGTLLKLRDDDGRELILNTASSLFNKAEETVPATSDALDELRKRIEDAKGAARRVL